MEPCADSTVNRHLHGDNTAIEIAATREASDRRVVLQLSMRKLDKNEDR